MSRLIHGVTSDCIRSELTVGSCSECPMEYDGSCKYPGAPDEVSHIGNLYDDADFDMHKRVHPLCPLRDAPLQLRVEK